MSEPTRIERVKGRTCGSCRLCCKLVSTWEVGTTPDGQPYEFKKARGKWCQHAGPGGCAIYTSPAKPWTCRIWACLWRLGMGPDEHRPDRVHFVPSIERTDGELHFVAYTDRTPYSRAMALWLDAYLGDKRLTGVIAVEPDGRRQRWTPDGRRQRVLRGPDDEGLYPSEPCEADPERAAMRELLGEEGARAASIDLGDLEDAMLRELGPAARALSWRDYVRQRGKAAT